MEAAETLQALLELADAAGLEVRSVGLYAQPAGEPAPTSAVCRVRDALWVVLSAADPPVRQIEVLAQALRDHRGEWLEDRWISPMLRDLLQD